MDVRRAEALDQLIGRQDLLDGPLAQFFAAQPRQAAKRQVGRQDGPVLRQHHQRRRHCGHHLLVVAPLGFDQREKTRNFTGFPLLETGALHLT